MHEIYTFLALTVEVTVCVSDRKRSTEQEQKITFINLLLSGYH